METPARLSAQLLRWSLRPRSSAPASRSLFALTLPLARAGLLSRVRRLSRETAGLVPGLPLRSAALAVCGAVTVLLAAFGVLIAGFGTDIRLGALAVAAVVGGLAPWGAGSVRPASVSALMAGPVAALLRGRLHSVAPLAVAAFVVDYALSMLALLAALALLAGPALVVESGTRAPLLALVVVGYVVAVGALRLCGLGAHLLVLARTARRERPGRLLLVHAAFSLTIFAALGWVGARAATRMDATSLPDLGAAIAAAEWVPALACAGLAAFALAAAALTTRWLPRGCAAWFERETRVRAERRADRADHGPRALEASNQLLLLHTPGLLRHGVTQVAGAGPRSAASSSASWAAGCRAPKVRHRRLSWCSGC